MVKSAEVTGVSPGQHEDHEGVIGEEGSEAVSEGEWLGVTSESGRGWLQEAVRLGARTVSGLEHLVLLLCGLADDLSMTEMQSIQCWQRSASAPFTPPHSSRTSSPPFRVGSHPAGERHLAGRHTITHTKNKEGVQ